MSKRSALSAVLNAKCPQCREGDLFTHGMFNFRKITSIHKSCSVCNLRYEKEPGYFYGGMYVSYALSTGIFLVTAFILYAFFGDPSLTTYLVTVITAALLLYPFNYRYSKVLFIYGFSGIKYDPEAAKTPKEQE